MVALSTVLINGDSVNGPRNWDNQAYTDVDEAIASADGAAADDNANANGNRDTSFLGAAVDSDLGNMDTLLWRVRRQLSATKDLNTRGLYIRIVKEADGAILAAEDSGGTFATIDADVTETSWTNGTAIAFVYVDTAASKADWDDMRIETRITTTKSMGGDSIALGRGSEPGSRPCL